jgi:hypothetical protein
MIICPAAEGIVNPIGPDAIPVVSDRDNIQANPGEISRFQSFRGIPVNMWLFENFHPDGIYEFSIHKLLWRSSYRSVMQNIHHKNVGMGLYPFMPYLPLVGDFVLYPECRTYNSLLVP